jgi:hypothetical protein
MHALARVSGASHGPVAVAAATTRAGLRADVLLAPAPRQVFHILAGEEAYGYGDWDSGAISAERKLASATDAATADDDAESEPPHLTGTAASVSLKVGAGLGASSSRRSLMGRRSIVDDADCPHCTWTKRSADSSSGGRASAAVLRGVMLALAAVLPALLLAL